MPRVCVAVLLLSVVAAAQESPPRCLDDRLKIELVAEHPQLVTPTGIDVDHLGRVFVIESNTHFPPDGYAGHPTDRVLILENTAGDAKADKITVFADGLTHTMSVAVEPIWLSLSGGRKPPENGDESTNNAESSKDAQPGGLRPPLRVFIATRSEILLLTDTDGDLKAEERKRLVHLETKGNYPHNGLAGFAFDALGNMFFGFGENLGADYKIIGSDGTTLSGGGEGGNLFRCKPDGSKLERWATGFWNPHASCFDAFGRLFTVDNDPDSRPPCRLLHIIPGGDYGYRFRNGRKGTHPFTSWNGEIPGTLPMVAGTGEGPSGIVCYENDGFPEDYLGTLLVGSWGDHRIDQFVLEPKGASFTSKAMPIIKGGENFRPVGLAVAPDGSLYFSDWVLKDYKLHGKGRVWRVKGDRKNRAVARAEYENIQSAQKPKQLVPYLESRNISIRRFTARQLVKNFRQEELDYLKSRAQKTADFEFKWGKWREFSSDALNNGEGRTDYEIGIADQIIPSAFTRDYVNVPDQRLDAVVGAMLAFCNRLSGDYVPDGHDVMESVTSNRLQTFDEWDEASNIDPMAAWHTLCELPNEVEGSLRLLTLYRENVPFHSTSFESFKTFIESAEPFSFVALTRGASVASEAYLDVLLRNPRFHSSPRVRMLVVLAMKLKEPANQISVRFALNDPDVALRRLAVQWVGEEKLSGFRPRVEALLADPTTTPDLFLACLATLQLLDGKPASEFEKQPPTEYVAALLKDPRSSPVLRATALRMLPSNAPELDAPLLTELLSSHDETLRIEAVRTLAGSQLPEARTLLLPIAANPQASVALRAEAVAGLCNGPHEDPLPLEIEALLLKFARGDIDDATLSDASQKRRAVETLQFEALRSLRGRAVSGTKIREAISLAREAASDKRNLLEAFDLVLNEKSDPNPQPSTLDPQPTDDIAAGRRVFFHHNGPLCAKCHTVQGRGGQVGPDLTVIARTMNREKLLASILEPSKEIAPQFTTWVIETANGKTHTGFILEDNRTGQIKLGVPTGETITLDEADIETREPSKTSVMPEKLHERMTPQELRDLLAFLETLK